jgi:hypothetical protein
MANANEETNHTTVEFIGFAPGMRRTCLVDPQDEEWEAPLVPAEGQYTTAQMQLY